MTRSHDAVIRVYDDAGNVIETHEHKGESGIADPFCYFRGLFARTSCTSQVLASIMNESRGLRDWCGHRNRGRIVRPGIRACSAPSPIGEMVTSSRHGTDRDN